MIIGKFKTECWNENKIINGKNLNRKLVVCVFEKWNLVVCEIEYVDVKKFGNGNVIDGGDEVFKKKYKENLLRKKIKYKLKFMFRKNKKIFFMWGKRKMP